MEGELCPDAEAAVEESYMKGSDVWGFYIRVVAAGHKLGGAEANSLSWKIFHKDDDKTLSRVYRRGSFDSEMGTRMNL